MSSTSSPAQSPSPQLHLYSYFRSSCAGRLRIALNLKQLHHTTTFVNLLKGEQLSDAHRSLNPSATVPVLAVTAKEDTNTHSPDPPTSAETSFPITQSIAALEYLEDIATQPALLPPVSAPQLRARVRTLVNIIACDIQPVTNLRIQKKVKAFGGDNTAWACELNIDGFTALEKLVSQWAGTYCVGDAVTLADVCLVPAVWAAQRVDVDFSPYPTVKAVFERLEGLEAVQKAHWSRQPDTPEELRG
ncbi:maleylacetoacetate isomerase [Paracoccidioides brasiliensis Pb18]|uniref:Maleylacetoacetate isomerase n=1 Tax=Paracoccidioides brasiliensis (strain Pb18) TaxID=502780 RepID=C1GMH8_PARBD|nr:maleylacetoacetate isomerase [Paracoccidioides brasiliensis Pb18]EEH43644.1 maleylacetoacetate isomerase [Paracoccidioides brasiliensis Pb18]